MKLAGAVTLYHCDIKRFKKNIDTYLNDVDVLYVLDNNEKINSEISIELSEYHNVEYINFGDNLGISAAFNCALKKARKEGYEFLLTMDQDSMFLPGMLSRHKKLLSKYETMHPKEVATYSINYDTNFDSPEGGARQIHVTITSGSIIPVELAIQLGGFDEDLFIDEVDTEFCYRLEKAGYKIIEFPDIIMKHSLGNRTYHYFLGCKYNTLNHNAIRKYYITRNKIYMIKKYPSLKKVYFKEIIKMIIKILLVESDKKRKIYYIKQGIIDGITGHMGKCLV